MLIQWFVHNNDPWVSVTADTRSLCQRIAFEIASMLPDNVVVSPFKGQRPEQWTQGINLAGLDSDVVAKALSAGILFAGVVLKGTALTPVEGVPIEVLESLSR